jgi:hypothetical protein
VEASRDELARLAEEHAALRRVATLVARGAPPEELFTAVVEEAERLFPGAREPGPLRVRRYGDGRRDLGGSG